MCAELPPNCFDRLTNTHQDKREAQLAGALSAHAQRTHCPSSAHFLAFRMRSRLSPSARCPHASAAHRLSRRRERRPQFQCSSFARAPSPCWSARAPRALPPTPVRPPMPIRCDATRSQEPDPTALDVVLCPHIAPRLTVSLLTRPCPRCCRNPMTARSPRCARAAPRPLPLVHTRPQAPPQTQSVDAALACPRSRAISSTYARAPSCCSGCAGADVVPL